MPRPRPLPRALGSSFSVREARTRGVTPARLEAQDLATPFRGVRMLAGIEPRFLQLCEARQSMMSRDQFFSHATAARIHQMWVPNRLAEGPLHITTIAPGRAVRDHGTIGHQLTIKNEATFSVVGGLRTVDAISAWFQLAASLTLRETIIMGDSLIRRQHPLATREQLVGRVRDNRRHRGQRRLRQAIEHVRANTDSPRETELRLELVAAGLPEPEVNPVIHDREGRFLAYGDLTYPQYRVLVEYDGDQHRTDDVQFGHDLARQNRLLNEGWILIRITKYHWRQRGRELTQVRRALLARGWPGAPRVA